MRCIERRSARVSIVYHSLLNHPDADYLEAAQGTTSPPEDFFAMDVDSGAAADAPAAPPQRLALDFGARSGSGVIGPKIDVAPTSRQADKFEVREGASPRPDYTSRTPKSSLVRPRSGVSLLQGRTPKSSSSCG